MEVLDQMSRSSQGTSHKKGFSVHEHEDMEMEAVLRFSRQQSSDMKITLRMYKLQEAINEICSAPLDRRRVLILYFHNGLNQFSKTFCESLDQPEISKLIENRFFFIGWDVSDPKFHSALSKTLKGTVVLVDLIPLLTEKESAAFFLVPVDETIKLHNAMKGPLVSSKDIMSALKKAEEVLQQENNEERQLVTLTKEKSTENDYDSIKYQMFMADMLGDRDYDSFEYYEHGRLKEKIGFALYGPPKKAVDNKGKYEEKEQENIDKLFNVILKNYNEHAEYKDKVEVSFITNCTEPLPKEKLKRAKKYNDYNPKTDINPIPIFILRKCRGSKNPCRVFVDHTGRVYKTWTEYLTENKLWECVMILPKNGRYHVNKHGEVLLEKHLSPACGFDVKMLLDIGMAAGGIISGGILLAAAIPSVTVAPAALVVGGVLAAGATIYTIVRGSMTLHDRRMHKETMSFANSEARGAYINIVAAAFGFAGAGATMAVFQLAARGINIGQGARAAVNLVNAAILGLGSVALGSSGFDIAYKWIKDNEKPSPLTIVQLESGVLFFGHAAFNFKTCSNIINQAQVLQEYQTSLRSIRHRKTFSKLLQETIIARNDGVDITGHAEVIKTIQNIPNRDEVFAVLTRNNKAMNKSGIRFSAEGGQIKLNGIAIDMNKFTQMSKKQANPFLNYLSTASIDNATGELTTTTPSTSFCHNVKNAFGGLGMDNPIKIAKVCNTMVNLCTEDTKNLLIRAASLLIRHLENIEYIDYLHHLFPSDMMYVRIVRLVMIFFAQKADEMEEQYNKWIETGDDQYYNPIFRFVNMNKANRCVKIFERCVNNGFSALSLIESVLLEMVKYFMVWFTKETYENSVEEDIVKNRKAHSANVGVKKNPCAVCGGHYFSPVKNNK